jgi:hypothetical protein
VIKSTLPNLLKWLSYQESSSAWPHSDSTQTPTSTAFPFLTVVFPLNFSTPLALVLYFQILNQVA